MTGLHGQTLSWTHRGDLLEVALHREPCNEIGTTTLAELEGLVAYLDEGAGGARAILLHSTQRAGFSAGADLRELHGELIARADRTREVLRPVARRLPEPVQRLGRRAVGAARRPLLARAIRGFLDRIHAVFNALDAAPIPVIGAVHGVCFGGGFELALTCDLLVADKGARFCFPELRLGLIPGFGGVPRLERDVGNAVVRDLLLSGRSLRATRAREVGLIAQVVGRGKALDAARSLAEQVLRFDPEVVAAAKTFSKPIPHERLEEEKDTFCRLVTHPRVTEALDDFVTREDVRPYLP